MALRKAEIIVLNQAGLPGKTIPVMFNPTEYSVSTSSAVSGEGANVQFDRVNKDNFSVTLFYDTYERGTNVSAEFTDITALLQPTVGVKNVKRPPICLFRWGGFEYKGIIVSVSRQYTMFLSSGVPVRANLTVTFKSVLTPNEDKKETGRDACRKLWTVRQGDRLDLIAAYTLSEPSQWPLIAAENGISDPMTFPRPEDYGRVLAIPDLV